MKIKTIEVITEYDDGLKINSSWCHPDFRMKIKKVGPHKWFKKTSRSPVVWFKKTIGLSV